MIESLVFVLNDGAPQCYTTTHLDHLPMALELLHQAGVMAEYGQEPKSVAECLHEFTATMVPLVKSPHAQLLQELDAAEFDRRLEQFRREPATGSHYVFDFDNDRFAATDWTEEGLEEYSCPLSHAQLIYSKARRNLPGRGQRWDIDNDYLSLSLGLAGDINTLQTDTPATPDEQPGAASAGPEMKM